MELSNNEYYTLNQELYYLGIRDYQSSFFETNDFRKFKNRLLSTSNNKLSSNFNNCSMDEIYNLCKQFLIEKFPKTNLELPVINTDRFLTNLISFYGTNPSDKYYDNIVEYIKKNIEYHKCFDIKLNFENQKKQNGFIYYPLFYENLSLTFYKKLTPVFDSITIEGKINDFTLNIFIHEIVHGLTLRNKGFSKNILHNEVLSIFMEFLIASTNKKYLDNSLKKRLYLTKIELCQLENYLKFNNNLKAINSSKYIISSIYAIKLFDIYSNKKYQKEIENNIHKIFQGEEILEDMLDKYNITEEKSDILVKKYLKRL